MAIAGAPRVVLAASRSSRRRGTVSLMAPASRVSSQRSTASAIRPSMIPASAWRPRERQPSPRSPVRLPTTSKACGRLSIV
ncbi:MAG: hypothetical protein OXC93_16925, partial [Rhodospirillaceae bacterium]|nr:hypothetical protein [Rhodospirillaceae bacterium]